MITKTILLVDDNADITNTIVSIFENMQWTFLQARNGQEGYEIACNELPDLIITDWEMPEGNGIELIKQLKANDSTKGIAIIMLTGMMTSPGHLEEALELGANDFIGKPFNEVELKARIISVLSLFDEHHQRMVAQEHLAESEKQLILKELEYSNKLLTQKISQQTRMGNQINSFIDTLNCLKNHCLSSGYELINQYIKDLQAEKSTNLETEFWAYFEQSHPSFFKRLTNRHPNLTAKEQKICALVMVDLINKHIAQFFSNSESTIKTTRKLLRRKLALSPETDLSNYLKSI